MRLEKSIQKCMLLRNVIELHALRKSSGECFYERFLNSKHEFWMFCSFIVAQVQSGYHSDSNAQIHWNWCMATLLADYLWIFVLLSMYLSVITVVVQCIGSMLCGVLVWLYHTHNYIVTCHLNSLESMVPFTIIISIHSIWNLMQIFKLKYSVFWAS